MPQYDEGEYTSEGEYEEYEEVEEEIDGAVAEEQDGDIADADDEEDEIEVGGAGAPGGAAGGGGGAGGQGQPMLYFPGYGYIPLSSLGNIPGLGQLRGGPQAQQPPQQLEGEKEWATLAQFPEETKAGLYEMLNQLKEDGRRELTVLLLGKGGVGKSSTINSLYNERAANVMAFQQDSPKPVTFSRRAAGFVLHLIDTPSLVDQDSFSDKRLEDVAKALVASNRSVDVVLYLDRLDNYKLGALDKRVLAGIARVLGPQVWSNTIICFTRASEDAAPPGVAFDDFVDERAQQLRSAIEQVGGASADLPVALIENNSQCPTNEAGEKVVPNGVAWIPELLSQIKDVATTYPAYAYDAKAAIKASNPDRRRKWLIPLVLLAQIGLKLLLDRVVEEDGVRGDSNGPFDAETIQERREELKRDKEEQRRKQQRKKQLSGRAAVADALQSQPVYADDDEEFFEDEEDEEEGF